MTRRLLGLFPGLALIGTMLQAVWEDYKPVSLSDAWARTGVVTEPGASAPSYSLVGAPGLYKFRVKATYTGKMHKVAAARTGLISKWGSVMASEDFTKRFEDEIQVRADGLTVWVALQNGLLGPWRMECKAGTDVELFMMYIGSFHRDRVFLVNDFEAK